MKLIIFTQYFLKMNLNIYNYSFPPLLFLVLPSLLLLLILKKSTKSPKQNPKPLPPGPRPWPIIGNLLNIGYKPHVSLSNLAKFYGPLMYLKVGSQVIVVASSPAAAAEVLKTHDRSLSGRCAPQSFPLTHSELMHNSLIYAPECSNRWKFLRELCSAEFWSPKAFGAQTLLREQKVFEMLGFLNENQGKTVEIKKLVHATITNVVSNLSFSTDFIDLSCEVASEFKEIITAIKELAITPNVADLYPSLLGKLDPQGLRRKTLVYTKRLRVLLGNIIKGRRGENKDGETNPPKDFLDVLIANGFSDDQIVLLVTELFGAASETTTITIEWAMTELLRNKDAMKNLREELERELSSDFIKESDLTRLPYLEACVKETLRVHAPAPFLIPHSAIDTCEMLNYTIPKGSQILVNVWAIGRDPDMWEDPLSFKPDRFLNSDFGFKGRNFEFLPFGSGRRQCPGLPLGSKLVLLILSSLIHSFQWSLPNGEDLSKLDLNEKFSVTLQKKQPLVVVPTRR